MKSYGLLICLSIFFGICQSLEDKCPSTDIKPCTCKTYFDGACIITCSLAGDEVLQNIADIPNLCNGHVHFVLVHSKVSGLPVKLWKVLLSSKTVDISIKHAGVQGLVPPNVTDIPDTYTSGEAVIRIDHSKVEQWDWRVLSKFYSEEELTIVIDDTPLPELSSSFGQIAGGQVNKVSIDSAGLTAVPDKLFVPFDDLNSLSLQNNKLTSVSRSVIAKPANKLQFLHLNGNQLTELPGDLFSDMPLLEVVYLRENQLKSLPQDLFQSITSSKLQRIDLVRNPWECDCRLMWILKGSKYHVNMGTCNSPNSVAQKKVRDLPKLLNC